MSSNVLCSALVALAVSAGGAGTAPERRIRAADFPSVAARSAFFEVRINAPDSTIRHRVLIEIGYFLHLPEKEYIAFLKRMLGDPAPIVSGKALRKLYRMWVPIARGELPQKFAGYHDRQLIDLEDPTCIPRLMEECGGSGVKAGYAAYVLGLLRHKPAAPLFKRLAADHNIFVRYTAARALIGVGEIEAARRILDFMSASQIRLFEGKAVELPAHLVSLGADECFPFRREPWYAVVSCRTLTALGPRDRQVGLERLIRLYGLMEKSTDINDISTLHSLRQVLATVTGQFFLSHAEAASWHARARNNVKETLPR